MVGASIALFARFGGNDKIADLFYARSKPSERLLR
jgi:hypothetical protein